MSFYICLIPAEDYHHAKDLPPEELNKRYLSEVSGESAEECLENLIEVINNDEIDEVNNLLKLYQL